MPTRLTPILILSINTINSLFQFGLCVNLRGPVSNNNTTIVIQIVKCGIRDRLHYDIDIHTHDINYEKS